jgi:hypothetical protein
VNVSCVLAGSTILDSEPHDDARPEDRDHGCGDESDSARLETPKRIAIALVAELAQHAERHVELLVVRVEGPLGGLELFGALGMVDERGLGLVELVAVGGEQATLRGALEESRARHHALAPLGVLP